MGKFKDFFLLLNEEKNETKYMCKLIYSNVIKKRILTDSEKILIKNQSIDVLKTLLLVIIFFVPFGSLILIGISFFTFRKYIFPSAFSKSFFIKKT